jgi:hypothetical protein
MQMYLSEICHMVKSNPIHENIITVGAMVKALAFQSRQELTVFQTDCLGIARTSRRQHKDSYILFLFAASWQAFSLFA